MWKPNVWSRVVGPLLLTVAGLSSAVLVGWRLGVPIVVLAVIVALNAQRTRMEMLPTGLRLGRLVGSFDLAWDQIAGALVAKRSFAVRELVILDDSGRFRRTGIWRWRSPRHEQPLDEAVEAINHRAAALAGVAELHGRDLRRTLEDYSRGALLRAAGLDEKGAERRSDRMLLLWLLTAFGSAAIGGVVGAVSGMAWVGFVVAAAVVATYFVWAARQPRLPPQRQAVRLSLLSGSDRRGERD